MKHRSLIAILLTIAGLAACQKPEPYMTLSDKIFPVGEEGEVLTFSISANTYYRVNNDMNWAQLEITNTTGDKTEFKLDVSANASPEARSGRVRFIGDGVTPLYVQVNQAGKAPVGVSVTEINVGYTETKAEFTILGTKPWTASCNNADFKLNYTSGNGETDIVVSFPENEASSVRTAVITVVIAGESYTVTINQGGAPSKERTDLSAKGTANCYIVDAIGYYKFKGTVAGNGVVPASQTMSSAISPASAKLLWCTYNTNIAPADNDALITGVGLEEGYIVFNTTDLVNLVEGNAVIAAYDSANKIIWSWHIWITDTPSDIVIGADKWIDRNVGALEPSTFKTTDPLAAGMFFQWGRKDPFRGPYTLQEPATGDPDIATTGTWPEPELISEGKGGIANSIANPQQVWYVSDKNHNNKDWNWGVQYHDLWGAGECASTSDLSAFPKTTKSMFDPCPLGYCVPSSLQFNTAGKTLEVAKTDIVKANGEETPTIYGIGNSTFYLVYAGGLIYDSGKIGGPIGQYSWYGTSCTNGVNQLCARSHTTAFNWGGAASGRSAGYSIRCVKE